MIKKFICGLVAVGSLGFSLFAADDAIVANVGIWKLNEAKSKFAKGHEEKDYTILIAVADKTITISMNGIGGFYGPGKPMSFKFTVPVGGGPLTYIENPPPPELGLAEVSKDIDDHTTEITTTIQGKMVGVDRITFNSDHKTMVIKASGIDEKGKAFKNVEIYEHQGPPQ
jgi:hypothetical protein